MPEYLAPAVYVEEIDTGSKPIEGVSTSTAGILGVTERGPVGVPILVTSYGDYTRWFGERLNPLDFPGQCFLPHAAEGFFVNGGKRLYVVRVLDTAVAQNAQARLFDRAAAVAAQTRLLAGAAAGASDIYVLAGAGLAVTIPPTWIQIGDGSAAEFRTISVAGTARSDIALRLPLAFAYDPVALALHVDRFAPTAVLTSLTLALAAHPGDLRIRISAAGTIAAGSLIRLGTSAGGDGEYAIAAGPAVVAGAAWDLTLVGPVVLPHQSGDSADEFAVLPVAPASLATERTTLMRPAGPGAGVLFLASNHAQFTTLDDLVRISDGTHTEVRLIGQLGALPLAVGAYAGYPAGTPVAAVTLTEDLTVSDKSLTAAAVAGSTVLELDDRQGLKVGDLIRIGTLADPQREYILIRQLPNPQLPPDAGKVILAAPVQVTKTGPSQVHRISPNITGAAAGPATLAVDAPRNTPELILSADSGYGGVGAPLVRITLATGDTYYHLLPGTATALTAAPLTLNQALTLPHMAGEPVSARTPLLTLQALDAGAWGNRLRVAVRASEPPLVRSRIRVMPDTRHLRLDSANGVEAGTILQRLDSAGTVLESVKVQGVDRRNDFLIILDLATPLSGAAAAGDSIRSQEFQLDIALLRQPDPAVPTRAETILVSESFPLLSLDPRHSRYVHKVMGTTWTPGASADDDGNPLRQSDRRSPGASWLVRAYDEEPDQARRRLIRLGPETLFDTLPSGTRRPARRSFTLGEDAVGLITDTTYMGQPSVEPQQRTGLHALENEEDISIVLCPGRTSPVLQGALIEHCEQMLYRVAVLDGPAPPNDTLTDVQDQRQQFDTKYAALYHPWLTIPDPYPTNLSQVADYPIPPSGHVAGIYARTDVERGVHKAPANEVVQGIVGLQRRLNKSEHDILNPYPININVIRDFRNNSRGIRVYGGRIITSDTDWKYVNVRRLLIFIEASLDRGLQWVVFEPNAEPLWARVRRSITNFLTLIWRNGALEGTKVEEAFFVKCDRTTMTQTDIDSGRLICVVGVAPVKPAEYVIVRIGLWTAQADA